MTLEEDFLAAQKAAASDEDNLWVELTKAPRPHELVPLPRMKAGTQEPVGNIIMVILTAEENMIIKKEADDRLKQLYKGSVPTNQDLAIGYKALYSEFCSIGILFRCCKRADDIAKPFFKTRESIAKVFTLDEMGLLLNHYYSMLYRYGPQLQTMGEEELKVWIAKITDDSAVNPSFLLNLLSVEPLKTLAISLANQLKILQMEKLSCSEPQESMSQMPEINETESL